LGISASLQGAPFAQYCKEYLGDKVISYKGHAFYFATHPQPFYVKEQFKELMTHSYKSYFLVFGDDCACSIIGDDNVRRYYNADISSCDSSHEEELFYLMFELFQTPEEIKKAIIGQIMARIRIEHPHDKRVKVDLYPKGLYLQSGITITTLINVLAWLLIFHSYVNHQEELSLAARRCGYTVTTDLCSKPQHIQFLKMSPMLDVNMEWQAVLNLGVIVRCSGVCRGDVPGSGDIVPRAEIFQSQLMNGVLAGIDYPPIHKLNPKKSKLQLKSYENIVNAVHHNQVHLQQETFTFNTEQFYARYDLNDADIIQLEEYYAQSCFGSVVYSSAAEKILKKDYGLELPKEGNTVGEPTPP
jgi:ubiquinone biosynthesis protein Coq4